MEINFFWKGNDFDEWCKLCILSHIKVGHEPIIWLSGEEPDTDAWFDIRHQTIVGDADHIFNVDKFIDKGGNFQTASALWRFHFLFDKGGWYCDTDAYAIQHFEDRLWAVCSAESKEKNLLSIGVLKVPPRHALFLDCINNVQSTWGNVKVFTKAFQNYFNHVQPTVPNEMFYPWTWEKWDNIYKRISMDDLIEQGVYSVHLYHTMIKRHDGLYEKKPNTLLKELIEFIGG